MTLDPSGAVNCPTCGLGLPAGLSFCPRCRAAAEGRPYDPGELDRHERSYVLSLVLLSLGALAVPRLLKSPAFGPGHKAALALLGVTQTLAALALAWAFFGVWLPRTIAAAMGR